MEKQWHLLVELVVNTNFQLSKNWFEAHQVDIKHARKLLRTLAKGNRSDAISLYAKITNNELKKATAEIDELISQYNVFAFPKR